MCRFKAGDRVKINDKHGSVLFSNGTFSTYVLLDDSTYTETINSNIEVSTMARPRKDAATKAADKTAKATNTVLESLTFCAPGYKEEGETYSKHAVIWDGWITTYNGIVQYGHPIDIPLQSCPHFGRLLAAVKAIGADAVQLAQTDSGRLSVTAKGFRTVIPCITDFSLMARHAADPGVAPLDSAMREGFEVMKQVSSRTGETIATSAVLIRNGDMIATDMHILVNYWHGNGFPELCVPADFIEAVLKVQKPLAGFGFTQDQSLTFYFADNSYIRTQLYGEKYPDVSRAMPQSWDGLDALPETFFDALDKVKPFLSESYIIVNDSCFATSDDDATATVVECAGLREAYHGMDHARISRLKNRVTHMDYYSDEAKVRFMGPSLRGVCVSFKFDIEDASADTITDLDYKAQRVVPPAIETEHVDTGTQTIQDWHRPEPDTDPTDTPIDEPAVAGGFTMPD